MDEQETPITIKRIILQIRRPREKQGIDLTKTEYEWLPDACNQKTEYTARIYSLRNGVWVYPGQPKRITFTLYDVSKEKGICMNFPMNGNTNPDLFFAEDDDIMQDFDLSEDDTSGSACPTQIFDPDDNPAHEHHYLKATTKEAVTEATVIVRCEDYGAFGMIKAEAQGCEPIPPRERNAEPCEGIGPNDVRIPFDEDGNNIADCAPQDDNGASPDSDEDSIPVCDGTPGDGLTNYEEYRGFIVADAIILEHIRTDINKKDLFIYDRDGYGTGWFSAAELDTHLLQSPEYYNGDSTDKMDVPDRGTQVINYNRGYATGGEQHALRLVDEVIPGYIGYCFGKGPGPPGTCNRVAVDVAECIGPNADSDRLDQSIAHEIGHAINLWHHGQLQTHKHYDDQDCDPAHSVTSGDTDCIMRYYQYVNYWCFVKEGEEEHEIHTWGTNDAAGTSFCTDPHGTGFNDVWYNNHATEGKGACKYNIRIKDW